MVQVLSDLKHQPRFLLEYHKFFWYNGGEDEILTVADLSSPQPDRQDPLRRRDGLMYGRKANTTDPDGFSVGMGALLDAKVKDLGRGFVADQPPPAGEATMRLLTRPRWSIVLFVTRTF